MSGCLNHTKEIIRMNDLINRTDDLISRQAAIDERGGA